MIGTMRKKKLLSAVVFSLTLLMRQNLSAQAVPAQSGTSSQCALSSLQVCALHVIEDEYHIVTSPLRIQRNDLLWIAPFAAGTGYTMTQDATIMQDLGHNPSRESHFNTASNVLGIYAPLAYSGAAFIGGSIRHNDTLRETSVLVTEAGVDSFLLNTALQYALNRQDPKQGDQTGRFWPHGRRTWPDGTSMPSEHCINVWSFARVVATEYPGWRTKAIVYGMATTVSASRVLAPALPFGRDRWQHVRVPDRGPGRPSTGDGNDGQYLSEFYPYGKRERN